MAARLQAATPLRLALLRLDCDSGHVIAGRYKDGVDQDFTDYSHPF